MTVNSNSNAARDPSQMLKDAFKLSDAGAKSTVQGTQLGAAAIMIRHTEMVETGSLSVAGIPSLAVLDAAAKSEARKLYVSDLIAKTCVTAPSRKGANTETFNVEMKQHAKQRAAVMRSFDLAIALTKANVSLAFFNDATKMFRVPANTLLEPGDVPAETTVTGNKLISLDGAKHGVIRGKQLATVVASVAQVIRVAYMAANDGKKPNVKGASNVTAHAAGTALPTADNEAPNAGLGLTQMVKGIASLAVKVEQIMSDEVLPFSDIDTDMINAFTEMQVALDTWNEYLTKSKASEQKVA